MIRVIKQTQGRFCWVLLLAGGMFLSGYSEDGPINDTITRPLSQGLGHFAGTGFDGFGLFHGEGQKNNVDYVWNPPPGDSSTVYLMNLRTGVKTKLFASKERLPSSWYNGGAYFTPDGKRIVFAHGTNLSIMNNDGTGVRHILSNFGDSWCLTAKGVFYGINGSSTANGHPKVYHVDIETGATSLVYSFDMAICVKGGSTDVVASQDGLKLFTRADMVFSGSTDCEHSHSAYFTFNPDLSVAKFGHAFMWGHGSALSRDGRYTFHIRWEDVPGLPKGWHKHFYVEDFNNPGTIIRNVVLETSTLFPSSPQQMSMNNLSICQNDENYIGGDVYTSSSVQGICTEANPHSVIFERGDSLWTTNRQYEIPQTPSWTHLFSLWKGTLPTPGVTPVLHLDKSELVFISTDGSQPISQVVNATNSGTGTLGTVQATKKRSSAWLIVAVGGSGNSQTITNSINIAGLTPGVYRDTVVVSCSGLAYILRYPVMLNMSVLSEPTALAATAGGDSLLDAILTWTDNSIGEDGFAVERSSNGGSTWTEISRTAANATTYTDKRPPVGDDAYRVRSFTTTTYSAYSATATVSVIGFPWISVSSPAEWEVWERGSVHTVRWSANLINNVTIWYSLDQGRTWTMALETGGSISRGDGDWSNYQFSVPDTVCSQALIMVQDYNGSSVGDVGKFNIAPHSATPPRSYLDSGWAHQAAIYLNTTANGANVAGNVLNFPVLVRLNGFNFDFSQSLVSGGGDIRFSKANGTELSYEIQRWLDRPGTGDVAEIWVKVDTVYGSTAVQSFGRIPLIYMYWGKSGVTSSSNSASVFDTMNGFAGVWHLDQEAAGINGSAIYLDATANGSTGKDYIQSTVREEFIGYSHGFHPHGDTSDYVEVPNTPRLENVLENNYTISGWYKPRVVPSTADIAQALITKQGAHSGIWYQNDRRFQFVQYTAGFAGMILSQSDSAYSPASYYYLTGLMARSLGSTKLYVNGVPSGSASFTVNNALADHEITPFKIGCGKSRYRSEFAYYADGEIDEVRVENVCRSADWVKLCYENQKASQTLVTLGTNIPLASVSKNKSERFGQLLTLGRLGKGITIRYVVPAGIMERVILSLFDSYGRMVWQSRYVGAASSAGVHEEFWTGYDSQNRRVSSGLYIVRLSMYDVAQQQAVVVRSPLVYISK